MPLGCTVQTGVCPGSWQECLGFLPVPRPGLSSGSKTGLEALLGAKTVLKLTERVGGLCHVFVFLAKGCNKYFVRTASRET